jgi:hypothetical protein
MTAGGQVGGKRFRLPGQARAAGKADGIELAHERRARFRTSIECSDRRLFDRGA